LRAAARDSSAAGAAEFCLGLSQPCTGNAFPWSKQTRAHSLPRSALQVQEGAGLGGGPQRMGNLSGTVAISGMPGTCPKILARGQEADRDRCHRIQGYAIQAI